MRSTVIDETRVAIETLRFHVRAADAPLAPPAGVEEVGVVVVFLPDGLAVGLVPRYETVLACALP
jgi:hypothetical protein